MNQIQQVFIVVCALMALPVAVKLLSKLHLVLLGMYFVAIRLIFPEWAAEHRLLCVGLFALCVLYAVGLWLLWYRNRKQEEQMQIAQLLARATPMYFPEDE